MGLPTAGRSIIIITIISIINAFIINITTKSTITTTMITIMITIVITIEERAALMCLATNSLICSRDRKEQAGGDSIMKITNIHGRMAWKGKKRDRKLGVALTD